jgi:hypothetical protein
MDGYVIADVKMYQQMVGKLIYLTITRQNIAMYCRTGWGCYIRHRQERSGL